MPRELGVPGLLGRLCGVPLWVIVCRRTPLHSSGYGRMTDGIRSVNLRTGTDGVRDAAPDGVHIKFIGNQDHFHDGAAQMASVWLCIVHQMACSAMDIAVLGAARLMSSDASEVQSDLPVPVNLDAWTEAGSRLVNRGIAAGDADLVQRALARFESVLAATRPGRPNHAIATVNTANALVVEFELTGRAESLDRAIVLLNAVEPDSADFGSREADLFSILGHALLRDAERSGVAATADRAVAARRRALELTGTADDEIGRA